jgi:hypothetical protein
VQVRRERTDWRDSRLNEEHIEYGYVCPCDNVEFLMVEYDRSRPVALVDYRLRNGVISETSGLLRHLCDNRHSSIPYFIAEYEFNNEQIQKIAIIPGNETAFNLIGFREGLSEKDLVRLLYDLRESTVPGRREQGIELANVRSAFIPQTENML